MMVRTQVFLHQETRHLLMIHSKLPGDNIALEELARTATDCYQSNVFTVKKYNSQTFTLSR